MTNKWEVADYHTHGDKSLIMLRRYSSEHEYVFGLGPDANIDSIGHYLDTHKQVKKVVFDTEGLSKRDIRYVKDICIKKNVTCEVDKPLLS